MFNREALPGPELRRSVLLSVAGHLERLALQRLGRRHVPESSREVADELFSLASQLEAESNTPHVIPDICDT